MAHFCFCFFVCVYCLRKEAWASCKYGIYNTCLVPFLGGPHVFRSQKGLDTTPNAWTNRTILVARKNTHRKGREKAPTAWTGASGVVLQQRVAPSSSSDDLAVRMMQIPIGHFYLHKRASAWPRRQATPAYSPITALFSAWPRPQSQQIAFASIVLLQRI